MRKTDLQNILTITEKYIDDILFDTVKTDIFAYVNSDCNEKEHLMSQVHYSVKSVTMHNNKSFKSFRVTIENSQVVANKALYSEVFNDIAQFNSVLDFKKTASKNYFRIKYKDSETLEKIIKTLRDNYYESVAQYCTDNNLVTNIVIPALEKKTTPKKKTTAKQQSKKKAQ